MPEKNANRSEGVAESTPNPHTEKHIADDVIETDHSVTTGAQNIAQTPSTSEGRLHPSVAEGVEGAAFDDDSMFNSADPQIRPRKRSSSESPEERKSDKSDDTRPRKIA